MHYFLKINKLIVICVSSVIGISVSNHLNSFNCIFFFKFRSEREGGPDPLDPPQRGGNRKGA